jgi:CO dehydrogenase/acetyl-CoA synthase beta subunit
VVELKEIRKFIEEQKLKNLDYSVWDYEEDSDNSGFLKIGSRVWDGIILDENVGIELGSPEDPVVKSIIYVEDVNIIHNSRITLIGKDLPEISAPSCKFGFLILIGGKNISSTDINKIQRSVFLSNTVEGIFEKQSGRKSWYQITQKLLEQKLSFFHIGSALINLIKQEYHDKIHAIELIMVTNDDQLLNYFREIHKVSRIESIKQFQEKIKTIQKLRLDCDFDWECSICDNKEICDQVRDMIARRNEMRRR